MSRAPLYVLVFAAALLVNGAALALGQSTALKTLVPAAARSLGIWVAIAFVASATPVGCAYATGLVRLFGVRRQAALHLGILAVSLLSWGFLTDGGARSLFGADPAGLRPAAEAGVADYLVAVLLFCGAVLVPVGVPLAGLTACVPLLQYWFARTGHTRARDPYFLFAPWCLGSLAGLLAYPTLVEPYLSLGEQRANWLWAWGLAVGLTAACAVLLWRSRRDFPARPEPGPAPSPLPAPGPEALWPPAVGAVLRRLHWVALSAVPVALSLSAVNYVSEEVSAIPLFELLLLVLSQLTLLLAFARQPLFARLPGRVRLAVTLVQGMGILACLFGLWLNRPAETGAQPGSFATGLWLILIPLVLLMPRALAVILQPVAAALLVLGLLARIWVLPELATHLLAVFVAMRCCHSELARDRPPPKELTGYFLCMALGAALGGLFVAVLAPLLFPEGVEEYGLALALACMLRPCGVRNGLSDRLLAGGLCALSRCGREAARLTRFVAALVMDWLYPLLVGLVTVRFWLSGSPLARDPALYALPLALCLLAVGRPVRFGLCLAAVLLARPLAPGPAPNADVTLLPGFGGPRDVALLVALVLLPLAAGTVAVAASLLSVLVTDGREASA